MRKIIACIITFTMLFTLVTPGTVHASTEQKIKLTEAIDIAKNLLDINTENYNFNYNYNENGNGLSTWELNWSSKKSNGGGINVSINSESGDILNYNGWDPYTGQAATKIPKYSREKAYDAVQKFLNKVVPSKYAQTVLNDNNASFNDMNINNDTYNFNFVRKVNGLEFVDNGINISIDKNTLKIRSYNLNWDNGPFTDPAKAIALEEAKKSFAKKTGIELTYELITDYTLKTQTPILVYALKSGGSTIDAVTGEVINNNYGVIYPGAFDKASANKSMVQKTPEEQKSIDASSKYISKDNALVEAEKYITVDDTIKLTSSNLYVNDIDNSAIWSFNWEKNDTAKQTYSSFSASVDAITGKVKAFSMNGNDFYPDKDTPVKYTQEQALSIAQKFINGFEPDKFKITTAQDNTNPNMPKPDKITDYYFSFVGRINGAKCSFDNFNIDINAFTGKVMNYTMNWNDIKLPEADKVMNIDNAYNALYKKAQYNLKYIKIYNYNNIKGGNTEVKLAYVLDNFSGMLDANNGEFLDYNGKPVVEKKPIKYNDIKGTEGENDISLLVDMGIIDDSSDNYNPNVEILQKDFIKLLIKSLGQDYVAYDAVQKDNNKEYDSYYDTAIQKKIITEDQKKPEETVTRQEAAKLIIKAMGIGYLAEINGVFRLGVKDSVLIPNSYKGYAALAVGLNIVSPINGTFSGAKKVTRGQSASLIVNYLKVDTGK
jgi:hypothetical protein